MPRFSVIVPAYEVQPYLNDCLRSVLEQDFTDLELIAVDDASPDACGAIIDEAAACDHRVRPVHLPENAGLGRARNAGIRRATGDYLLFLDGDDTLAPGSLRAIADRLARTGEPQVLVFDYARVDWTGEAVRNVRAELLRQGDPESVRQVFRLDQRPELLRLLMVAWNKAYRRDFVRKEGFAFPPGFYEDTPWTFPVLLTAESIAVLDRVCVHYRQRRRGGILRTTSRRHLDVFEQYDRVFRFLDARPGLAHWRPALFQRMVDHFGVIAAAPGRLPVRARAEFFRRAGAHHRRYRPLGAATPPGRARWRGLLLRLGARRAYELLRGADRLRRRTADRGRTAYARARRAALWLHYRLQRCRPVDPGLAVFAAYWHRGYAGHPAAIEAKVRELAPGVRTAWITTPEYAHTLPPGVRRLQPGSAAYWTALARARFLVNNVNFTQGMRKRPGQIHLQTHHGTPLKHMGLDLRDRPAAARGMDFGKLMERVDRWDYSLSANRHTTLVWERVYPSGYTTLPYGAPRNDVFQHTTEDEVARLRARLGIPAGTVAVLYAPTHRDYQRRYVPRLDLERVARALGPGFTLLVRRHYFHAPATGVASPGGRGLGVPGHGRGLDVSGHGRGLDVSGHGQVLDVSGHGPGLDVPGHGRGLDVPGHGQVLDVPGHSQVLDVSGHGRVEELCLAADALLTDYSSLMFDYANLDRPIVIHADDWDAYRAARGTYFDITAAPPGPVSRTEDELIALFAGGAWCGARSAALRAAFRARFCPYDDGRAAERVVRRVFLGERPALLPPVVPLAERRPAPAAVRTLPNGPAGAAGAAGPDRAAEPLAARRAGVVCAPSAAPSAAPPAVTRTNAPAPSFPHRSRPH
ncbi:bifunctional glycosyltransferase family 2 protein/CDP-glycerol:glycerophosphate glycerophosphotransferase [Streptomyces sp. PSAA01]|uniref:bifunctional glycosyltransferase/CDP-glycerol:glycerophosphate glycerophosphotransferase n=1 Tax=Streptomyces sp. PSAA01 TaxID=2912762 RepID=UPI001F44AE17|nr:bifunctional glycosyltransferase family 2 protein/CDP-glycerol:glycerophosphate glycerophosphotransferase [Streptomyces sp. PSAA01]MCG0290611.1 bifunctional glycosyltransferase family 2 protein/CDP-glycerol:glycerophosphate glycerophosphotransferase [Streptomyces sp. PSAA01]